MLGPWPWSNARVAQLHVFPLKLLNLGSEVDLMEVREDAVEYLHASIHIHSMPKPQEYVLPFAQAAE